MEKSVTEGQQDIRVSVVGSQVHRMKKKMIFYLDSLLPWKVPGYPLQDNKVLTVRKGNLWTYGGSGSIHERTGPKSVKIPRLCLLQCHQSLGLTVNKTHIFLPAGLVS